MATYTIAKGSTGATHVVGDTATLRVSAIVNLSPTAEDDGDLLINSGEGVAATESVDLMIIPAGTLVERVFYEVLTASDTLDDFEIGEDGVSAGDDEWVATVDATSTGNGLGAGSSATADTLGKYYATEDNLVFLANTTGTHTTGRIRVTAIMTSNVE
jgi:hypothetical protein